MQQTGRLVGGYKNFAEFEVNDWQVDYVNKLLDVDPDKSVDSAQRKAENAFELNIEVDETIIDNLGKYKSMHAKLMEDFQSRYPDLGLVETDEMAIEAVREHAELRIQFIEAKKEELRKRLKDSPELDGLDYEDALSTSYYDHEFAKIASREEKSTQLVEAEIKELSFEEIDQGIETKAFENVKKTAAERAENDLGTSQMTEPTTKGYQNLFKKEKTSAFILPLHLQNKENQEKSAQMYVAAYAQAMADLYQKQGDNTKANRHLEASAKTIERDKSGMTNSTHDGPNKAFLDLVRGRGSNQRNTPDREQLD